MDWLTKTYISLSLSFKKGYQPGNIQKQRLKKSYQTGIFHLQRIFDSIARLLDALKVEDYIISSMSYGLGLFDFFCLGMKALQ